MSTDQPAQTLASLIRRGSVSHRVTRIVQLAEAMLHPTRIWLFGSRARGDNRPLSDIDLAFEVSEKGSQAWATFASEVDERPITLLGVDLVDIRRCDVALAEQIRREGVLIYEQP